MALFLFLILAAIVVLAQVIASRRALEQAAPLEGLRKFAAGNRYWEELVTKTKKTALFHFQGGQAIGMIETLLMFAAFCAAGDQSGYVIAGYFAFKVASKWQVWSHIYRLPEQHGRDPDDWHIFRSRLGHLLFTRFVLGSALNVLIALLGGIIFHGLTAWASPLPP